MFELSFFSEVFRVFIVYFNSFVEMSDDKSNIICFSRKFERIFDVNINFFPFADISDEQKQNEWSSEQLQNSDSTLATENTADNQMTTQPAQDIGSGGEIRDNSVVGSDSANVSNNSSTERKLALSNNNKSVKNEEK